MHINENNASRIHLLYLSKDAYCQPNTLYMGNTLLKPNKLYIFALRNTL